MQYFLFYKYCSTVCIEKGCMHTLKSTLMWWSL